MNPYSQLHMMQQAGAGQFIPGLGTMGPSTGGASTLHAMAGELSRPTIAGSPMVNTSPMASINYQGPGSGLANLAGNLILTPMMQSQGMLPMGNAGSYMQAQRQNQFQAMQGEVIQGVAGQDAESFFRTIRGGAALAGIPMNQEQTAAARDFSKTLAQQGPLLEMFAPGLLDAVSGETGSIQSMAAQVTNANRYRVDPSTGQMGFSQDSNKELIDGLFESLFNQDNIVKMQGLRAGDMGQLYNQMSAEGLAGPKGSLRDRTIESLRNIQNEGGDAGVNEILKNLGSYDSSNLETLSNEDLATLRDSSSTVTNRITESDTDRISNQLQDYVKSLSAIREVFGENGNPNAPIPQLVGALEALTGNNIQQFDASRLNTMVRDMQSLSQASGKSIDQITAMQQNAGKDINAMTGYGGEHFAAASAGYGVTTGQAFQQVGGARGFGALDREEAEQAAQSLFNRSINSQMSNTLGAVSRLEDTGLVGEESNLAAAMQAVRQGDEFYTDSEGRQRRTPTREDQFRQLVADAGISRSDFNMTLGDTYENRKQLSGDEDLKRGAVRQQFFEYEKDVDNSSARTLMKMSAFKNVDEPSKLQTALKLSSAANDAAFALSPEDFANDELREKVMREAIQSASEGVDGLKLSEADTSLLVTQISASQNKVAMKRTGLGAVAVQQIQGREVSNAQRSNAAQAEALSKQNEAMSVLGQKGTGMRRLVAAIQKQGDRGEAADMTTLIQDTFGAEDINAEGLSEGMQKVKGLMEESDKLRGRMDGAPAEERRAIEIELDEVNDKLMEAAEAAQKEGRRLGLNDESGSFNLEDNRRSSEALKEIDRRTESAGLRDYIKNDAPVNEEDLESLKGKLTSQDVANLDRAAGTTSSKPELTEGVVDDEKMKEALTSMQAAKGMPEWLVNMRAEGQLKPSFDKIKNDPQQLRNAIATGEAVMADDSFVDEVKPVFEKYQKLAEERLEELEVEEEPAAPADPDAKDYSNLKAGELTDEEKEVVLRGRRLEDFKGNPSITEKDVEARMGKMRRKFFPDRDEFSEQENRDAFKAARSQLMAEKSLQAIGVLDKGDSLMDSSDINFEGTGISKEAIELISSGDPAKQLEAVKQIATDSRKKAQDLGLSRVSDIDEKDTEAVAGHLSTLATAADEYLQDADALTKGGSLGEASAKEMQEALSDLQALANDYSVQRGDLGAAELLQRGVHGLGPKTGAEVQDKIDNIRLRIKKATAGMEAGTQVDYRNVTTVTDEEKAAAEEVLGKGLSDAQIKAYSLLEKTKAKNIKEVKTTTSPGYSSKTTTIRPNTKKPTLEEATELADNLIKLRGADDKTISLMDDYLQVNKNSEKAYNRSNLKEVMEKEQYVNAATGENQELVKSLTLFGGDEDKLKEVEDLIADRKRQQEALGKAELSDNAEAIANAKENLERTEQGLSEKAAESNKSVSALTTAMEYQDDLKKLQAKKPDESLDMGLFEARKILDKAALKETESRTSLSNPENIIRKALGFKPSDDVEMDLGASGKNARMLADELGKLSKIDSKALGLDNKATAVEKLDAMQDRYAGATTEADKNELAASLGLERKQLDRSMTRTGFMQLDTVDMSDFSTPDKKAELMQDRLKSVEGRSIEDEAKAEEARELKLSGNLTLRGAISGEAQLSDVIGLTSAAGIV